MSAVPQATHLVLQCALAHVAGVLGPFERKGFALVGLRPDASTGRAVVALRSLATYAELGGQLAALCAAARASLPPGSALLASNSQEEALGLMHAHFGPREIVQWGADDPHDSDYAEAPPLGHPGCAHAEAVWLDAVLHAEPGASVVGATFLRLLKRDGYVALLLTRSQAQLWHEGEIPASQRSLFPSPM